MQETKEVLEFERITPLSLHRENVKLFVLWHGKLDLDAEFLPRGGALCAFGGDALRVGIVGDV